MAKRFADGAEWALVYREFRQNFFTAFGEGGSWREEEWGKKDLNAGASCAWRRYKSQGKSAAQVKAKAAPGQRNKKRRRRSKESLHRHFVTKEEKKVEVRSAFRAVGICFNCGWVNFGGKSKCVRCETGALRFPEELEDDRGKKWIEEWKAVGVHTGKGLRNKRDQVNRCSACNIIRPLTARGSCPICRTHPGKIKPTARGKWMAGVGEGQFRCNLCMRRGKGKGSSCPNRMCLGKLGVQGGRTRRPKKKERRRRVLLRNEGGGRRGKVRDSSSGSSGSEFEPSEWDPQIVQGGSLRGVKFSRENQGNRSRTKESPAAEVWLSLWEGTEMGGCAALQKGGKFWVGSGEGCEIRLSGRDIGKKHTGLRVDEEGIVWITDLGCRGGTRMAGGKLEPHSERRLCGGEFWCGRSDRHFKVSQSIPSHKDPRSVDGEQGTKDDHTTSESECDFGEQVGGVEITFRGITEKGHVDDFVIAWSDRGMVENFLLRNGQSCWMGAESGEGITWSNSLGWRGRLAATQGFLSLSTERPAVVRGLGTGEGLSTGYTVFQIQGNRFTIMTKVFYCSRICFSHDVGFLYGEPNSRERGTNTVQRTAVGVSNKLGKLGVERGIT